MFAGVNAAGRVLSAQAAIAMALLSGNAPILPLAAAS